MLQIWMKCKEIFMVRSHFPHAANLNELRDKETFMVSSVDGSHHPHAANLDKLRDKETFIVGSVDGSHYPHAANLDEL